MLPLVQLFAEGLRKEKQTCKPQRVRMNKDPQGQERQKAVIQQYLRKQQRKEAWKVVPVWKQFIHIGLPLVTFVCKFYLLSQYRYNV